MFSNSLYRLIVFTIFSLGLLFSNQTVVAQLNINNSLLEGQKKLVNREYTEAIKRFNDVIRIKPDQHLA